VGAPIVQVIRKAPTAVGDIGSGLFERERETIEIMG
jgi:hypothetical protein